MRIESAALGALGIVATFIVVPLAPVAWADPPAPVPPPAPGVVLPGPAPGPAVPDPAAAPLAAPAEGTPHLPSPDNLPPGTTETPIGPEGRRMSYLRDLWHAVQTQEVSGGDAILLLTQRPMDPGATSNRGLPSGPVPAAADPAPGDPALIDPAVAPVPPPPDLPPAQ